MKITISGKNMAVTEALKEVAEKKLSKLDKYLFEDVRVDVTLSVEKNRQIIEVTIPFSGAIIRAEESTDDMYQSIDKVIDVLERQIRKHKTKLQKKNKGFETIRFENVQSLPVGENGKEASIVRTKRFAMKPMDAEEAVLQMELLRHAFYVFRDAETNDVHIVYKRKDGNYGLIEPEF